MSRRGFTLLEAVVAGALLATLAALALGTMGSASEQVALSTLQADLQARAHDAAALLRRELRVAARGSLALAGANPENGAQFQRLSYRQVVGFDAAAHAPLLSPLPPAPPHELRFEPEPGETVDGADEDGDGLVDEGRLTLARDGVDQVDLAAGVRGADLGFSFESGATTPQAADACLIIHYTLQQRGRRAGEVALRTQELRIGLRN